MTNQVRCVQCGSTLEELVGLDPSARKPCPTCGSLGRTVSLHVGGAIMPTGEVQRVLAVGPTITVTPGHATVKTVESTVGRFEEAARVTVAQHRCELVWDAPSDDQNVTMLCVYVDGVLTELAMQRGDTFGLLMELADTTEGILPPWDDEDDEDSTPDQ